MLDSDNHTIMNEELTNKNPNDLIGDTGAEIYLIPVDSSRNIKQGAQYDYFLKPVTHASNLVDCLLNDNNYLIPIGDTRAHFQIKLCYRAS
jgi:hypothetical protein